MGSSDSDDDSRDNTKQTAETDTSISFLETKASTTGNTATRTASHGHTYSTTDVRKARKRQSSRCQTSSSTADTHEDAAFHVELDDDDDEDDDLEFFEMSATRQSSGTLPSSARPARKGRVVSDTNDESSEDKMTATEAQGASPPQKPAGESAVDAGRKDARQGEAGRVEPRAGHAAFDDGSLEDDSFASGGRQESGRGARRQRLSSSHGGSFSSLGETPTAEGWRQGEAAVAVGDVQAKLDDLLLPSAVFAKGADRESTLETDPSPDLSAIQSQNNAGGSEPEDHSAVARTVDALATQLSPPSSAAASPADPPLPFSQPSTALPNTNAAARGNPKPGPGKKAVARKPVNGGNPAVRTHPVIPERLTAPHGLAEHNRTVPVQPPQAPLAPFGSHPLPAAGLDKAYFAQRLEAIEKKKEQQLKERKRHLKAYAQAAVRLDISASPPKCESLAAGSKSEALRPSAQRVVHCEPSAVMQRLEAAAACNAHVNFVAGGDLRAQLASSRTQAVESRQMKERQLHELRDLESFVGRACGDQTQQQQHQQQPARRPSTGKVPRERSGSPASPKPLRAHRYAPDRAQYAQPCDQPRAGDGTPTPPRFRPASPEAGGRPQQQQQQQQQHGDQRAYADFVATLTRLPLAAVARQLGGRRARSGPDAPGRRAKKRDRERDRDRDRDFDRDRDTRPGKRRQARPRSQSPVRGHFPSGDVPGPRTPEARPRSRSPTKRKGKRAASLPNHRDAVTKRGFVTYGKLGSPGADASAAPPEHAFSTWKKTLQTMKAALPDPPGYEQPGHRLFGEGNQANALKMQWAAVLKQANEDWDWRRHSYKPVITAQARKQKRTKQQIVSRSTRLMEKRRALEDVVRDAEFDGCTFHPEINRGPVDRVGSSSPTGGTDRIYYEGVDMKRKKQEAIALVQRMLADDQPEPHATHRIVLGAPNTQQWLEKLAAHRKPKVDDVAEGGARLASRSGSTRASSARPPSMHLYQPRHVQGRVTEKEKELVSEAQRLSEIGRYIGKNTGSLAERHRLRGMQQLFAFFDPERAGYASVAAMSSSLQ
eukprot:gene5965-9157_t